ncbi:STAS-like domain-containing protein [Alicyclobacillus sp. SO9]|uniref:STAS-like domain-containing protein n=1 Tax=Alicyclobacillus sp. SO9 TaxID=2665646 RepID=UPI0018E7A3F3|nr:STAS-like domain-containing protein [Alicyclobacillus sp. SO9]
MKDIVDGDESKCFRNVARWEQDGETVTLTYRIISEVGRECTARSEGHRLFLLIWHDLATKCTVELDFAGVTSFSQTFFDALYGELLKCFQSFVVMRRIHSQNLSLVGWDLLHSTLRHI